MYHEKKVALARVGQGIGDAACSPFAASILRDHFGPEVIGSAIGGVLPPSPPPHVHLRLCFQMLYNFHP